MRKRVMCLFVVLSMMLVVFQNFIVFAENTGIDTLPQMEPVSSLSQQDEETTEYVLSDFSKGDLGKWSNGSGLLMPVTSEITNGDIAAKYYIPQDGANLAAALSLSDRDLSKYNAFYMWAYSPVASGNQATISAYAGTHSDGGWRYFGYKITLDFAGWKLICIPFSSMTAARDPQWDSIERIYIQSGQLGTTAKGGTEFYISKIWASTNVANETASVICTTPLQNTVGVSDEDKEVIFQFNGDLLKKTTYSAEVSVQYTLDGEASTDVPETEYDLSFEDDKLFIRFRNPLTKAGAYKIKINGIWTQTATAAVEYTLSFSVDDGTAIIVDAVNRADTLLELGNVLNTYSQELETEGIDYADTDKHRNVLTWVQAKKPYLRIQDIKNAMDEADELLEEINACNESNVEAFLIKNQDKFPIEDSDKEKFINLPQEIKVIVSKMMADKQPYSTVMDFVDEFHRVISSMDGETEDDSEKECILSDFTKGDLEGWKPGGLLTQETPEFTYGDTVAKYYVSQDGAKLSAELPLENHDLSSYNAFYMWVYSPVASGNQAVFTAFAGFTESKQWRYAAYKLTLDFKGWKLICIPFASMSKSRDPQWDSIESLFFQSGEMGTTAKAGTEFYVSKIWVSENAKEDKPEVSSVSVQPGATDVKPGESYEIVYSANVYANTFEKALCDLNGVYVDTEITAVGNKVNIKPHERLESGKAYTLNLKNVYGYGGVPAEEVIRTFTVAEEAIGCSNISFSISKIKEGSPIGVSVQVYGRSNQTEEAELVLAAFDKDGYMYECAHQNVSLSYGEEKTVVCTLRETLKADSLVKSFLLHTNRVGQPILKKAAVLKNENSYGESAYESFEDKAVFDNGSLKLIYVAVEEDGILVKARTENEGTTPVVIIAEGKETGTHAVCNQIDTDQKGCLTFKIKMNPVVHKGWYTVSLSAAGMTNRAAESAEVYFAGSELRNEILKCVNAAGGSDQIGELLNQYDVEMALPKLDYASKENAYISDALYAAIPYKSYEDIIIRYRRAVETLAALNGKSWDQYIDIIAKNRDIIFDNDTVLKKYNNLSSADKGKALKQVGAAAPYPSFQSFEKKLAEIIASMNSSSVNTGGGTGGGSVNKGGFQANQASGAISPSVNDPQLPVQNEYLDLSGYEWAQEYIYTLKNKGVLTIGSDRLFRPGDRVTREEFVKMMVCAKNLEADGDIAFADVSENDWFYPYIRIAYCAGVINGTEPGLFGAGMPVTREQMAAIAYRCDKRLYAAEESVEVFSDDSEIEGYAKEAVYSMKKDGIINGIGDGRFAPKAYATRAEAAKIIAAICD